MGIDMNTVTIRDHLVIDIGQYIQLTEAIKLIRMKDGKTDNRSDEKHSGSKGRHNTTQRSITTE